MEIVKLVDYIFSQSCRLGASDIHIDPIEDGVMVRVRVDGLLSVLKHFSNKLHPEVISRIKILAGLRTDEHQRAQDGRIRYWFDEKLNVDLRISIIPTYYGENVVIRILQRGLESLALSELGFSSHDEGHIREALKRTSGMILCTGPTGSGKTTTLYSLISLLQSNAQSIITLEDPIEYALASIRQIQVNAYTGMTFAHILRSILRQDPDTLMVGEIRDAETAEIAVNISLTGHLLLSTLHTTNAVSVLPRLCDMGIESYLLSSTISIIIAQRLVRKLCICHNKKTEKDVNEECRLCRGTGYKGRISINEVLVINDHLRELISKRASIKEMERAAMEAGMRSMREDGLLKVEAGVTTLEEVARVLHE